MKIGLDLDDTITNLPEFFSILTRALLAAGHEVHVLTFRSPGTEDDVIAELETLGIGYTKAHLPVDSETPQDWKRKLAEALSLDVMIDDSPEVLEKMPPGVKRLWVCDSEVFDLQLCLDALRGR